MELDGHEGVGNTVIVRGGVNQYHINLDPLHYINFKRKVALHNQPLTQCIDTKINLKTEARRKTLEGFLKCL